jgi:DNA mismatch repair protein MutS
MAGQLLNNVRARNAAGPARAGFCSILYDNEDAANSAGTLSQPAFFPDLNLNQIIDAVTADWQEYDLAPFFYTPLASLEAIAYRQDVMDELGDRELLNSVNLFSSGMRAMRARLQEATKSTYRLATERLFLEAVVTYCRTVHQFADALAGCVLGSKGFAELRDYFSAYANSEQFRGLSEDAESVLRGLSAIRYSLLVKDGAVTVRRYEGEEDYSIAVEATFEKFRREQAGSLQVEARNWDGMNHIEGMIQERLALLFPDEFRALDRFYATRTEYLDSVIFRFDREVQFYVTYLAYLEPLRKSGLEFCRPVVLTTSKEVCGKDAFDLALARKLIDERGAVVCNDFYLRESERIFIVSGPNQGGKTTFARMFGQMHYLASLGCPVAGSKAKLFLFDRLFTHFEREEQVASLRGKLQDDLVRIHTILKSATPSSLIILNEIFSSTTLKDAVYLGRKIMTRMSDLDLLGVCVTFLDELASLNEKTVSVVSLVDRENPAVRTFKLERKPADGLAFALAIAEKYGVTYDALKERIKE